MRVAMVGLGKMGGNMARRLMRGGHEVVAFARSAASVEPVAKEGAIPAVSLADAVSKLSAPRVVWLMIPAGEPVSAAVRELAGLLSPGDVVVDGGNSRYTDAAPRAALLAEKGIRYADAGTSGGVWGLSVGYCLMVGGEPEAFAAIEPLLATLAPPGGCLHAGPHGAGHFVKMVHNGIEYGLMQAYAEGFDLLDSAPFPVDLHAVAALWNKGSVVRSWLLELAEAALAEDPSLAKLSPWVDDSGEGRWTVDQAIDSAVPLPVISSALFARFASRRENPFGLRLLAALRNQFGGHAVKKAPDDAGKE
jgi:6-phosphogluconate dehydrogenase